MSEIKLSLSIELRESTMFSRKECLKTTQKTITAKNGRKRTVTKVVGDWDRMKKHPKRVTDNNDTNPEIITFHTGKCKPATQSLNMSKEAYEYMIDKDSCPSWSKPGKWAAMSEKKRLEAHLQRTVEHLGGVSYTYQVFED